MADDLKHIPPSSWEKVLWDMGDCKGRWRWMTLEWLSFRGWPRWLRRLYAATLPAGLLCQISLAVTATVLVMLIWSGIHLLRMLTFLVLLPFDLWNYEP